MRRRLISPILIQKLLWQCGQKLAEAAGHLLTHLSRPAASFSCGRIVGVAELHDLWTADLDFPCPG